MFFQTLNKIFEDNNLDAIISEAPQTRLWYSGISTTDGLLIIEEKKATLFVDSRYIEYAKNNAKNVEIILLEKDSFKKFLLEKNFKNIGFEENYLIFSSLKKFKSILPHATFYPIDGQKLRIQKSEAEIRNIQKAIDISIDAFEKVKTFLIEGVTEKEIAAKFNYLMKRLGAEKESFDEIVAFGPNTAEPHHHPTDRELKNGDIVKMDFGAYYNGYASDVTRTFFFNEQESKPDPKLKEILEIVEEAARLGREAIKPGITASEIDKICRDFITEKGYGNFFLHSTGHGLGIDVHELPSVSFNKDKDCVLKEGMIITIEPGIYIENLGGARIEDDVLVTENGHRVLSRKQGV
ncbi:MAG: aminopeptidase P family protein [Metamycoplasmataceae bacterium]